MEQSSTGPVGRFTDVERADFVALYRNSGLTQRAFADQHGLNLASFNRWLHRFKADTAAPCPVFKELILPPTSPAWSAEIIIVRLGTTASPDLIAQVVNSLRRPC